MPLTPTSGNLRALCAECATVMHKRISTTSLAALEAILSVTNTQADRPINKCDQP